MRKTCKFELVIELELDDDKIKEFELKDVQVEDSFKTAFKDITDKIELEVDNINFDLGNFYINGIEIN